VFDSSHNSADGRLDAHQFARHSPETALRSAVGVVATTNMLTASLDVRSWSKTGKHFLTLSFTAF
jgi:hypothetical protein